MFSLLIGLLSLTLLISYLCFRIVFYVPPRKQATAEIRLPKGKIYEPFWEEMRRWTMDARSTSHEDFSIRSFDGLRLSAKYYEFTPNAPIEIMFHGYRGDAERDLSGGMQRCFQLGHSAFIVDQRCAGNSEGNVITFGIKEHRDCLSWIEFVISHFGSDVNIILTGISMGASTVLMASGKKLPSNVVGVLADCGFTTAKDIILHVAGQMHLPAMVLYPFVKLGAWLFGGFRLEEYSALEAVKDCKVPVIFFHGESDDYVPSYMSQENFAACSSRKRLVLIPGAGHGLSYPIAKDRYVREVFAFFYAE